MSLCQQGVEFSVLTHKGKDGGFGIEEFLLEVFLLRYENMESVLNASHLGF